MSTRYRRDMCTCAKGVTCAADKAWIRKHREQPKSDEQQRQKRVSRLKAQLVRAEVRLAWSATKQNKWRVKMLTTSLKRAERECAA